MELQLISYVRITISKNAVKYLESYALYDSLKIGFFLARPHDYDLTVTLYLEYTWDVGTFLICKDRRDPSYTLVPIRCKPIWGFSFKFTEELTKRNWQDKGESLCLFSTNLQFGANFSLFTCVGLP